MTDRESQATTDYEHTEQSMTPQKIKLYLDTLLHHVTESRQSTTVLRPVAVSPQITLRSHNPRMRAGFSTVSGLVVPKGKLELVFHNCAIIFDMGILVL